MLVVLNKEKIISYIVAISTVIVLFLAVNVISINNQDTIQTMANVNKDIPIYSVSTEDKKVSLTINCAWNADDIDSILQTLSKNNIKTTFFMVGTWVDKYPDAVKKIADAGHDIANHSDTHAHVSNLNFDKNIEEIKLCADKIENLTGRRSTLYRGPYGEYNDTVMKAAANQNHIVIQWSIDTLDYQGLKTEQMWNRIDGNIENGSIILMHNGTENTASSLQTIIDKIKAKDYQIVPISELIYKDNYIIDSTGKQHSQVAE